MTHLGELLSAYLDGEVAADEQQRVAHHLSGCTRCREDLVSLSRVRAAVRGLPLLEVPGSTLGLPEQSLAPVHRRPRVWIGAAAAAAAVLVVLASFLTPDRPVPMTVQDLSTPFGARVSLDPAFTPAKVVPVQGETIRQGGAD